MPDMIQIIKQAAVEAVEKNNPMRIMYGTVVSESPVSVKIDQKFTVTSAFLILTHNVSDYKTKIKIDGEEKEIEVKNGLKNGDRVMLMQEQGGQQFIVLDKVG